MSEKTLIYIIGAGRSGTTLLDIILGNNTNSISLGEINRFFKRKGNPPKRDLNSQVHLFWEAINKEVTKKHNEYKYSYVSKVFKKNEYHSHAFKVIFNKNDKEYSEILTTLYNSLYLKTSENILIESSKYPLRALNISRILSRDQYQIKYIYLKKDPVKVVQSFQKKHIEQPSKGFFAANVYYLFVNLLCRYIVKLLKVNGHNVSIVNYKDIIENSQQTINSISKDLNLDLSDLKTKLDTDKPLNTGFLFDGNRIRLKETLSLQTSSKIDAKNLKYYFTRMFNYIVYN
ncbi:sulfotransferase [Psychroserpens ponticola]|uniref:Sulfotransferase n=1 Tax=Psychroserpens ponticola TaxID=2932268 RepID=A0ABY7RXB4_9FLAO|nr:sulfotransferase [Psychroserpens ponticola]WCO01653.1 sulfotransferase [Psychroserpens ponticola]